MGCVFSKPLSDETDDKFNVFKVVNIDQDGNGHYPGKIEITAENLLLYQNKKEPLSWPIRSLRRYGVESNIFSFEVGRRCPTGEGIFAFRCDQAEQLFRLLQTNIQSSSTSTSVPPIDLGLSRDYLEPRVINPRQSRLESVGSTSSYPVTPVSPSQPSSTIYDFELVDVDKTKSEKKNAIVTTSENCDTPSSPAYINVPIGDDADDSKTSQTIYLPPFVLPISNGDVDEDEHSPKNLKYITLEFDSKTSSPIVKTPAEDDEFSPKYTTIDLQRTWALSQSTKPNIKNDIGCTRRTRHNSDWFGVNR